MAAYLWITARLFIPLNVVHVQQNSMNRVDFFCCGAVYRCHLICRIAIINTYGQFYHFS